MGSRAIYVAGPMGFFEAGRIWHHGTVIPTLESDGWRILDPWASAAAIFGGLPPSPSREQLNHANQAVGAANEDMIRKANAILAILDGSDIDSGTAAEIGFAAGLPRPVIGLRTDLRMSGDNPATTINLQVAWFVERSGGQVVSTLTEAVGVLSAMFADSPGEL